MHCLHNDFWWVFPCCNHKQNEHINSNAIPIEMSVKSIFYYEITLSVNCTILTIVGANKCDFHRIRWPTPDNYRWPRPHEQMRNLFCFWIEQLQPIPSHCHACEKCLEFFLVRSHLRRWCLPVVNRSTANNHVISSLWDCIFHAAIQLDVNHISVDNLPAIAATKNSLVVPRYWIQFHNSVHWKQNLKVSGWHTITILYTQR